MRSPRTSPARPTRRTSLIAALLGLLATTLATTTLATAPAAAAPPYTLDERAVAITSPSLVFLEARLEGFMRIRATGALVEAAAVSVYSRCSGFVVGSEGYVVTTTHCLAPSPDSLRGSAAYIVANDLIRDKKLTQQQKADFIAQLMRTADLTGATPGSPPVTTVSGQLFVGLPGQTDSTAITGQVVDSQPTAKGDVALVKLDKKGLPVAQLDDVTLNPDTHVATVGFGTSDPNAATVTYTTQSRGGKVVGKYGADSLPRYQLDGDIGPTSNGGMVVDGTGHVVGMINADMASKDRTNQLVTPTSRINEVLSNSGVRNTLAPTDEAYRAGLDAYFGGRYTDAIRQFDTVLAATPSHLPAQTYRKHATDRRAIEGDPTTNTGQWLLIAAGAVLFIAVVAAILMFVRGRGRRTRERELGRFVPAPVSGLPISGTPTSGMPISGVPISGVPISGVPISGTPISGVPVSGTPVSGVPVSGGVAGGPGPAELTAWAPDTSGYVLPPYQAPAHPPYETTSAPAPDGNAPDWPALAVWRAPHPDGPVPPPGPAPNTSTGPEAAGPNGGKP
jgi:hypothetical protein